MDFKKRILQFTGKEDYHFGDIISTTFRKTKDQVVIPEKIQDITSSTKDLEAVKQGWIYKMGQHVKKWKKRYFILTPHLKLFYFSGQTEASPKGVIYLEEATVEEADFTVTNQTFSLVIKTKKRDFFLYFESQRDLQEWTLALQSELSKYAQLKKSSSLLDLQTPDESQTKQFLVTGICCLECMADLQRVLRKHGIREQIDWNYNPDNFILSVKPEIPNTSQFFGDIEEIGLLISQTSDE